MWSAADADVNSEAAWQQQHEVACCFLMQGSYFAEDKTKFFRQYSERAVKQPSPEMGEKSKLFLVIEVHFGLDMKLGNICTGMLFI